MILRLENKDCMEVMAEYPNAYFDIVLADPPYGINITKQGLGKGGGLYRQKQKSYKLGNWDSNVPNDLFFNEIKRISKNQIIWGGNYFNLNPTPCYLVWDKNNGGSDFADCELAWTSFKSPIRKFFFTWSGFIQGDMKNRQTRIHPTQKPIQLYYWILKNYANKEMKILDPMFGSGSSIIASDKFGVAEFVGCEIDKEYFDAAVKRYKTYKSQTVLNFDNI